MKLTTISAMHLQVVVIRSVMAAHVHAITVNLLLTLREY
jgi:hypothetical protein